MSSPTTIDYGDDDGFDADFDAIAERHFEDYKEWCAKDNSKPSLKDFLIWLEDQI